LVDALMALEGHFRQDDKELKIQDSAGSSSGNDARFLSSSEPSMNCLYIAIVIVETSYQGCRDWLQYNFTSFVALLPADTRLKQLTSWRVNKLL
jgi:hypothetical protein